MPITYLDEEEEELLSPLQQTPLTQPRRRKITYIDEEPAEQQAGLLPPIEEMFKPKPKPESLWRQAADIPVGLGKGAAQGVRMFTDILGADNPVSQSIRGVEDYLGNLMSAQAKNDQAEIARIMEEAQDKGVLDQVLAGVKAFTIAPVDLTVQALGTMAPVIAGGLAANTAKLVATGIRGGAAAARGLTAGQMAATQAGIGAGMGAGVVKGTIYDEVKNELISQGLSEEVAHQQAVKAQEYSGKNLDQILLGAGLGAAAATTGAEKIIGGILTKTGVGASKSRVVNALKTGVTEAFPEAAQGAQEQLAANIALQREGMDVPTTRGVFSSGALEGIAGFGVGAPLGAIQKASVAEDAARKAEEADAPATAEALRKSAQEGVQEEKDISEEDQTIEDIEKATRPSVPIGEEFVMPPKEEFKASYAKLTPESLAETEASFQEQLQDEDADTRAFAQTALEALAEFKAEQTPVPTAATTPAPAEAPLEQRPLATETGGQMYQAEAIKQALANKQPIGADAIEFFAKDPRTWGIEIPRDYIKQGNIYVPPPAVEAPAAVVPPPEAEVAAPPVEAAPPAALEPTAVAPAPPIETTPAEPTPAPLVEPAPTPVEVETAASLSRVADNTATDEEVVRLARQGLVNIQDGQNVITPRGEEVMQRGGAPLPRLTPEERAAEVAAAPAIVEQAFTPTPAPQVEEIVTAPEQTAPVSDRESRFLTEKVRVEKGDPRFIRSEETSAGPGGVINTVEQANLSEVVAEPSVYHESSLGSIRNIVKSVSSNLRRVDLWVSNSLDLALGQGGKGYVLELDTTKVNGSIAPSLAAEIQAGRKAVGTEIKVNKTAPSSIKSIIAPNNAGVNALRKTAGFERLFDFDNAVKTERGIRIPARMAVEGAAPAPTPVTTPAPAETPAAPAPAVAEAESLVTKPASLPKETPSPTIAEPTISEAPSIPQQDVKSSRYRKFLGESAPQAISEAKNALARFKKSNYGKLGDNPFQAEPRLRELKNVISSFVGNRLSVTNQKADEIAEQIILGKPNIVDKVTELKPIKAKELDDIGAVRSAITRFGYELGDKKTYRHPREGEAIAAAAPAAPAAEPAGIAGFDRTDIEFPSFDSLNDYQKKSYREGTPVISGRAKGFIETEENFFVDPAQLPAGAVVNEDLDAFAYPKEDGTIGYVFMDLDGFAKPSIAPDQLAAKVKALSTATPVAPAEAAPIQRDVTKPEQMTPDEAIDDALRKAEISPTETGFMAERDRGIVGSNAEEIHYVAVSSAIESLNPVSAEAVESYGIPLPEGYTKQGDLYVYQPTAPAAPTPVSPAAEPTGISVGSKIQLKGNKFNKYVAIEVLPQTDFEVRNNERSYILKNERTGEVMPRPFTEQDFDKVGGKKLLKMAAAPATSQLWATPPQEISSADTSINQRQMPATFKRVKWQSGTRNADIGGGRFDNATEYLAESGVENVVYDPYNRTQESNQAAVAKVSGGQSDTATVNNVLNVIAEPESRDLVIRQAADAIKPDGKAYFLIYEGDKKGTGSPTKAGWQENRKAETYVAEIRKHFGSVTRKGNLIIAEQPAKPSSILRQATEIRVEEDAQVVPEADRYTFEEAGIRAIEFFGGVAPEGLLIVNDSVNPDYRMKAGYDPETGEIILNRAFIRKGDSIEDILTHELGHYIFSDPKFQADFKNFLDSMPDNTRAQIEQIINKSYNKDTNQTQIEERQVMAFTALVKASKQSLSAWENLKNTIKRWINRVLRTNIKLSDEGAMAVFNVGYKRFKRGDQIVRAMEEGVLRMAAEPTAKPTRRTKMQSIIDISTGVKRPRTKLTVDEMAALKDQIRIGARKRREDKQTQKEFAKDVTEYLRGMAIRGKVSAPQLRAVTSKAMQTQFDNEASIKSFINYANKVIENANYNRDISEARAAIKSAKRLAKQKGVAANIKANLEKLANIDPRQIEPEEMVEVDGEMPVSVAEFTAVLKEYMKAAGPVTAEGYILVPDAEITDFLSKIGEQVEVNRKANENLGLDGELAEIADKTPEEIDAELAKNEERRKRIEEKINKLAETAQIGLVKYENPEMTSEEKLVLDDMKRITLSDISIGERKEFVKVANNILVNNKFLGAQKFASIARGQIGAVEAAKDSKTVKRNSATLKVYENLLGENFGRLVNLGTQSFADTFRNLTGTKELPRLLYQMGFGEIERGQANTNRARREITDGVQARFKQIEKDTGQKISDTQGVYSMGVAGNLIQIHPDETQTEGIQRMRGLIQSDIEKKRKSPKSDDRKAAIYIQKALDEVDSDTVEGVLENLKRLHPANHKAMTFLMNEVLPEYKPMLKEHDELFNNQTENYENPYYLPIRYRSIGTEPKKPGELRGRSTDSVTAPKQAPNSIKRIKNTVIPEGKQLDYNLTRNVLDSLSTQLEAAYTNPGWQQVYAFLKSPEAVDALGGVENYDFVTKRINNLSDSRERKIYQMDPFNQAADFVANMVRKIGTSIALGGVGQVAKQMPDQIATTVANVMDREITTNAFFEMKAALPAMRQFSIGERGEIAGGSKWVNQLEGNFTKLQQFMQDGLWPKAMEAFENINNFWLIPLKIGDTIAATHGWISYYKKYLKDNNIPFTNWDNEAGLIADGERGRVEAGLYADQMIDLYQGSSDPTKMATFAQRGDSGGGNLLKTMIMPFSSFVIQQRSRILSDLRDVSYGNTDEKKVAAKGLAGTLFGIVLFHGMRRYALPLITGGVAAGAYGLLGVDMEEPDEEEKAEKDKRVFRQFLGEVASNIFVGGYSAYAETRLIDAINATSYFYEIQTGSENALDDEGEILSWEKYRKERAPMYRYTGPGADSTLGMIDILPSQTRETFDRLKDLSDDKIMDSLTEEEQRVLILAALSETLYTMRLNDADVARMIKRMAKDVKDQAEARQKAERKLQRLYGL